jgi:hypothetical protein
LSLKFGKSKPTGLLECTQIKTPIDKICIEEVEADGIYPGKQIKPYMPV